MDAYDELLAEFLSQLEAQVAPDVIPWPPEFSAEEVELYKRAVSAYVDLAGEYRPDWDREEPQGERRRGLYWCRQVTRMISCIMNRAKGNPEFLGAVKAIPELIEILEAETAWARVEADLLRVQDEDL